MKQQLITIGGGDTFRNYREYISYLKNIKFDFNRLGKKRWKETLPKLLGPQFNVLPMRMPNSANAKYKEWKIMFDKLLPFLKDNVVLLGHSLGGIFLAKYLAENNFPRKIKATFLISAPFDEKKADYTLGDFKLPKSLAKLQSQAGQIFLYHSLDDKVVPFTDLQKYKRALPKAKTSIFKNGGHFDQANFPELIKDIKSLNLKK